MATPQAHLARVVAAAAFLAWAAPAAAQAPAQPAAPAAAALPNVLEILGARTVEIPSATPTGKVTLPPLAVRALGSPLPDGVEIIDVTIDGRGGGLTGAFEVTLAPRARAAGIADLVTTVDLGKAVRSATYVAKLLPTRGGVVVGAAFDLSFVRPAGGLQVASSPLRIEVTTARPLGTTVRPRQVDLTESTRIAGLADLRAVMTGALKGPGEAVDDGHVDVKVPSTLPAGQTARVDIVLTRHAQLLGTSKGVVTLSSPNLTPPIALAVEVVTRRWLGWLAVTLAIGMLTGAVVRHYLEKNEALVRARRDAKERVERLQGLATRQPDPDVRKQLEDLVGALRDAMRVAGTPEALDAATAKAATDSDTVLNAAKESRARLREKLQALRVKVTPPDPQPALVREVLDDVRRRISLRELELKAGLIGDVERDLTELERQLPPRVRDALEDWRQDVLGLGRAGAWPGTTFAAAQEKAVALAAALGDETDTGARLRKSADLGSILRYEVFGPGLSAIADIVSTAATALGAGDALDAARRPIETLRQGTLAVDQVDEVAEAVRRAHEVLATALRAARPDPVPAGFDDAVSAGRFTEAARMLPSRREPEIFAPDLLFRERLPEGGRVIGGVGRPDDMAAAVGSWSVTIQAPSDVEAGTEVQLILESSRAFPVTAVVRWLADGRPIGQSRPGVRIERFTPREPGATQIEAVVTDDATGERATAQAWIDVKPADEVASAAELSDELARWTVARYAIVGVVLVGAGMMIFKGTWVGSFDDIYPAFLWGFSTDIAVAKIRELASPVLSKALPAR